MNQGLAPTCGPVVAYTNDFYFAVKQEIKRGDMQKGNQALRIFQGRSPTGSLETDKMELQTKWLILHIESESSRLHVHGRPHLERSSIPIYTSFPA